MLNSQKSYLIPSSCMNTLAFHLAFSSFICVLWARKHCATRQDQHHYQSPHATLFQFYVGVRDIFQRVWICLHCVFTHLFGFKVIWDLGQIP